MIADTVIRTFVETYNKDAIQSIENMTKNRGYHIRLDKVKSFDIEESFNKFLDYLEGYKEYCIKDKYDIGERDKELIIESTNAFLDSEGFTEKVLFCVDANKFIKSYIEGCKNIVDKVNNIQNELKLEDATDEEIGNITEYTDIFMEKMNTKFNSVMNSLLRESGYIKTSIIGESMKKQNNKKKINFI